MDWRGERLSLERAAGAPDLQMHLTRHVWALKFVDGLRHCDIGCGTGFGAWLLSRVTESTLAFDPCAAAIEEARERYHGRGLRYEVRALEQMIGCQPMFATVTAFESLEHTEDLQESLRIISECLLLPEGLLLGSVPLCAGENPYHHGRDYDAPAWVEILSGQFSVRHLYYQPIGGQRDDPRPNTDLLLLRGVADVESATDGNLLFVATSY